MRHKAKTEILFLNHDMSCGGAERALLNLLTNLDRTQFSPTLWVRRKAGELLSNYQELGIEIHEMPDVMSEGARRWLIWKALKNVPRMRQFHIVHSFCSNAWWAEPWSVRLAGIKGYIIRKSDCYMHGPERSWHVRHHMADRIIAVSPNIFNRFYRNTPLAMKTHIIWNGTDIHKYRPLPYNLELRNQYKIPSAAGLFVCIANLSPYKGQLQLLITLAYAKAKGFNQFVIFVGRDLANGQIQKWADELGVRDRAIFIGAVADVPKLLAGCDGSILLSPSEGCPNAILESMSCGVPVIANKNCVDGLIQNDVNGYAVNPGDMQTIVDQMLNLSNSGRMRDIIGAAARQTIIQNFSLYDMVKKYEAVYEELLMTINHKKTQ